MNLKEAESGSDFNWKSKWSGELALSLAADGKTIQGMGHVTQSTDTDVVAVRIPGTGAGKAPSQKTAATARGKLLSGNIAKLRIVSAVPKREFQIEGEVGGDPFSLAAQEGGFNMEIEIPFRAGAEKTETKTLHPIPGMTNYYNYRFTLKTCR